MRRLKLILCATILSACSTNSGVVPTGSGTYIISKAEWGVNPTGSSVKVDALKEANDYCTRMHKEIEIVRATQKDMVPFKSEAQAEVEFHCR